MDYKYIEQLLERYWMCETSLAEERILKAFFSQEEIPAHLIQYKVLFEYEAHNQSLTLGEDFDRRILEKIEAIQPKEKKPQLTVKAKKMTISYRMRPLFRAAASIAIFVLVGSAVQQTFNRPNTPKGWDYNAANYQDTYNVPQKAFEVSMSGINDIKQLLESLPNKADSLQHAIRK